MQGQGINCKDRNNEKDFIARLDYRPTENWRIVATGQLGRGHAIATSKYNPGIAVGQNYTRNRWSGGAEWKSHVKGVDYWKNRDDILEINGLDNENQIMVGQILKIPGWSFD